MIIKSQTLKLFVFNLLIEVGTNKTIADFVSSKLVNANLSGHPSHGVMRLPLYVDKILKKELKPNLVIFDVNMGGKPKAGIKLARYIKKNYPNLVFVFLTSQKNVDPLILDNAAEVGADTVYDKNDFATWIYDIIGDVKLADTIRKTLDKKSTSRKVKMRITKLKKIAGLA